MIWIRGSRVWNQETFQLPGHSGLSQLNLRMSCLALVTVAFAKTVSYRLAARVINRKF